MASQLDPGAQDPDFEYLMIQLRHIGVSVEQIETPAEEPTTGRCPYSGLTIPECSCTTCVRELIMRYGPASRLR